MIPHDTESTTRSAPPSAPTLQSRRLPARTLPRRSPQCHLHSRGSCWRQADGSGASEVRGCRTQGYPEPLRQCTMSSTCKAGMSSQRLQYASEEHHGDALASPWPPSAKGLPVGDLATAVPTKNVVYTLQKLTPHSSTQVMGRCTPPLKLVRHTLQELTRRSSPLVLDRRTPPLKFVRHTLQKLTQRCSPLVPKMYSTIEASAAHTVEADAA